jgi:hypothetical protein
MRNQQDHQTYRATHRYVHQFSPHRECFLAPKFTWTSTSWPSVKTLGGMDPAILEMAWDISASMMSVGRSLVFGIP